MKYIDRCYTATVHPNHERFTVWLEMLSKLYDDGKVEYAMVALETSNDKIHLQPFVVFNESAWTLKEGNKTKTFKPTEVLAGHWSKARSLSGARDYSARRGIHISKPGLLESFEFGEWVDPAYNSSLRTRLSFEFAARITDGETVVDLAISDPSGVLVVGQKQLEDLYSLRGRQGSVHGDTVKRPYYYIGRSDFLNRLKLIEIHYPHPEEEE
ncbi:MAG: hypothetical protein [Circoviridae sp.]|nr:MAG: hypothetical protein [Circoviridae sp.]